MLERELKFYVPARKRASLEKRLRKDGATDLPLHACYFDTQDHELAKRKIALRVRQEGELWVQTIKTPGPDELSRIEINHPRPGPTLDLGIYEGTSVEGLLSGLEHPLTLRYETQVQRLVLKMECGNSEVELAYDQGVIKSGGLELPLCELELELVTGDTAGLFELAGQWLKKYGLILDLRSKAERGDALARLAPKHSNSKDINDKDATPQALPWPQLLKPRRAGPILLTPDLTMQQAYQRCATDCINQIIRNTTFLAAAEGAQAMASTRVDYVHQIRVGIRRIRSCWKFFGKWIDLNESQAEAELRNYFSQLGKIRDRDVIDLVITPRLVAAGMPELELPPNSDSDDGSIPALAASPRVQAILLTLLQHLTDTEIAARNPEKDVKPGKAMIKRLNKRIDALCEQGEHFVQLSIEDQHRLRKRLKGLRYSMEFAGSLLAEKRLARLREALITAQHTLGDLNDLYIADDFYRPLIAAQPQAYFAIGWLHAMQEQKKAEAQGNFTRLHKAGRFKKA
ncbi:inorganic triphosphatase [Pollutimonas subterranea]|uniref:Inorganic triphosphatase n=1 Tax=Pollutimonas subterranea TaxID=2045210 RepID=A0A2N4U5P2_9BURK|nr:CYTH and CHAD domain-containing protein [Pollutimonas subterranea]PLC50345.1 inorganic triphosphatase [Pollutimonas subterranea]